MTNQNLYNVLDKKIKVLETKGNNFTSKIDELKNSVEKLVKLYNFDSEIKAEFDKRIESLYANQISDSKVLSKVSPKSILADKDTLKKYRKAGIIAGLFITGISLTTCVACNAKKESVAITSETPEDKDEIVNTVSDNTTTTVSDDIVVVEPTKVLSENLSFDPNDNSEVVNRLSNFISDAWSKGIDVPVDKMMDYYLVMNIEDINPVDYARLGYTSKTTDSIVNNYFYCANMFMDDTLTVLPETKVDYTLVIADKDSSESLNEIESKLADLNAKSISILDVHDYIYNEYIENDPNIYNAGANNQAYRIIFSFDELTNGKGLSKDENDILNEDRNVNCGQAVVIDGEKTKSDKAQEQTSIFGQLEEKLSISRDFYAQDLTNITEIELKTGVEIEQEITLKLNEMGAKLIVNPEFKGSYSIGGATNYNSGSSKNTSKGTTGGGSSDSESSTVGKKTEATGVGTTTYTDTTGTEVDMSKAADYVGQGASDANAGVDNSANVPEQYRGSYMNGWGQANAAKEEAKKNSSGQQSSYENADPNTPPTITESIIEEPYQAPIEEFEPINNSSNTQPSEAPVVPETITTYETIDYTSKINNLNNLKAELFALANSTNVEEKAMKM